MSEQQEKLILLIRTFLVWFWGENNPLLYIFIMFIIINCITGIMCALIRKNISCHTIIEMLFKKSAIFLLIGSGHLLDVYVLKCSRLCTCNLITGFYIAMEGSEIITNCETLHIKVPRFLHDILTLIKDIF